MGKLFVLSGSAGCGKTTLMNNILRNDPSICVVQKYGTRRRRPAHDGLEDDVCQVFRSPFPETIRMKDLLREADGFISTIWEREDPCGVYCVRRKPLVENQTKFCKLIGDHAYFSTSSQTSAIDLAKLLAEALKGYYSLHRDVLELKDTLSREERQALSNVLEDLQVRTPVIVVMKDNYWDDYGDRVSLRGTIDIAYALNKGQYGISSESIRHELDSGKNVITILSDFRVIKRLKVIFGDLLVAVYVASAVDTAKLEKIQVARLGINGSSEEQLRKQLERLNASVEICKWENAARWIHELNKHWEKTKPDADNTAFRAERIQTFHTRYIDNITLFDHVILNYNEGHAADMTFQFVNILDAYPRRRICDRAPVFVVSAASNAGKGTMMEMLNLIGSDRVQILSKIAQRKRKRNDKKDGMIPIGTPEKPLEDQNEWPDWWNEDMIRVARCGEFPKEYDFQWSFHGVVRYAVSDEEIKRNLSENRAQIVISNTDQIEKFIHKYGDHVVFILLYRLSSIEDTRSYYEMEEGLAPEQAEARANEVKEVLQEYIKKIGHFSHVILNTTRPQDMYDQIFQLVEFYNK